MMDTKTYEEVFDGIKKILYDSGTTHNEAIGILETIKAEITTDILNGV
jgi:hypothetical protein